MLDNHTRCGCFIWEGDYMRNLRAYSWDRSSTRYTPMSWKCDTKSRFWLRWYSWKPGPEVLSLHSSQDLRVRTLYALHDFPLKCGDRWRVSPSYDHRNSACWRCRRWLFVHCDSDPKEQYNTLAESILYYSEACRIYILLGSTVAQFLTPWNFLQSPMALVNIPKETPILSYLMEPVTTSSSLTLCRQTRPPLISARPLLSLIYLLAHFCHWYLRTHLCPFHRTCFGNFQKSVPLNDCLS